MRIVLVESSPDAASVGIARELRSSVAHREEDLRFDGHPVVRFPSLSEARLVCTPNVHITDETLDRRLESAGIKAEMIIFLSKHKSESGRPTLTAHPMGNIGAAQFGGQPHRLTPTHAGYLSEGLRALGRAREEHQYQAEVSFEATHHGPLLSIPAMFIELGSSDQEWGDPRGHQVLSAAVQSLLGAPPPLFPSVIGLGGGHYGPRFTEAVLSRRVNVAHIIPTYHAKEAKEVEVLAAEAVRASPGASVVYYQDGTIPKEPRERWLAAFNALGLPLANSKDWAPL